MTKRTTHIEIQSAVIQVNTSLYPVDKISDVKIVKQKWSFWGWLGNLIFSRDWVHAILMRNSNGSFVVLAASRDTSAIFDIFGKMKNAMSARASGNFTYVASAQLATNLVNQTGDYSSAFNSGHIEL